jgi:hypothetical protein
MASKLKVELARLQENGKRASTLMSQIVADFHSSGGICCPCCWSREYSDTVLAQERRRERARYLIAKIRRDGGVLSDSEEQRVLAALS